jgi:hypothetical protein
LSSPSWYGLLVCIRLRVCFFTARGLFISTGAACSPFP